MITIIFIVFVHYIIKPERQKKEIKITQKKRLETKDRKRVRENLSVLRTMGVAMGGGVCVNGIIE